MANPETTTNNEAPTRDASDVYDRQIRLWGAEAQAKMSKAKVLYIHITAATSEIMKNLVLAGIPAALFDPRAFPVAETSSFFLACEAAPDSNSAVEDDEDEPAAKKQKKTMAQAVQPAVEDLNPLLGGCPVVEAATVDDLLQNNMEILASYSVVVASRLTPTQATMLADIVTQAGNHVFLIDTFGMDGACVMDLGSNHSYRPEKGKELLDPVPLSPYVSMAQILATPLHESVNRFHKKFPPTPWVRYRLLLAYFDQTKEWPTAATDKTEFATKLLAWCKETSVPESTFAEESVLQPEALEQLCAVASAQLAPVASVLGGLVGNEIIKALSGKGAPSNNTLLLDGSSGKAWTFLVQPKKA
eukprot:scaffold4097_cov166-Amphora_coffeaeformis.AAC.44